MIYLKLMAQHYEWLKPRAELPSDTVSTRLKTAKLQPFSLHGGGSNSGLDREALAQMGLESLRVSSANSRTAKSRKTGHSEMSLLGLKPKKTTRSEATGAED